MEKPLRQHIAELERRVQQLSQEMMQNRKTREQRNRLESELRVAQQALAHYRRAIKIETQPKPEKHGPPIIALSG